MVKLLQHLSVLFLRHRLLVWRLWLLIVHTREHLFRWLNVVCQFDWIAFEESLQKVQDKVALSVASDRLCICRKLILQEL